MNNSRKNSGLLSSAVVSVIDQALLSAVNLLIGLAFIKLADKAEYGIYVQLFALMMLSQTIQNSMINGPILTFAPKRRVRRRRAMLVHLFRFQSLVALGLVVVSVIGLEVAILGVSVPGLSQGVVAPFALAVFGLWTREYARTYYFLRLQPAAVMAVDAVYVGFVLAAMLLGALIGSFGVSWVLAAVGLGNLLAATLGIKRSTLQLRGNHGRAARPLGEAWAMSRWTLPGAVTSWVANHSFVFIVAGVVGVTAAADVSAARILLMPAGLCVVAWSKIFLPRASTWIHDGQLSQMVRVGLIAGGLIAGIVGVYSLVLVAAYPLLEQYLLGQKYAGLLPVSMAWSAFFVANGFRVIGTIALTAAELYRPLLVYTVVGQILGLPLVIGLTHQVGAIGAVWALATVECVLIAVLVTDGRRRLNRRWAATA